MFDKELITDYNLPEKLSDEQMKKQSEVFAENKILVGLIDSISQMLVILNKERQIVYANKPYYDFCGFADLGSIIGMRSGDALKCVHAAKALDGCNTTDFCKTCGAAQSLYEVQLGIKSTKECRITTTTNESLDLRVTAAPYEYKGQTLTVFTITDIGDEKRREALERIFFHDILNSASGISGLINVLGEIEDRDEIIDITNTIQGAAEKLIDEIQMQHQLISAERGDLNPTFSEIDSLSVLTDLKKFYSSHNLIAEKTIVINENAEKVSFNSDPVLLRRIIGNMIKNALEDYNPGEQITLHCQTNNDRIQFSVHNSSVIKPNVQIQLFKRSFSTKGSGRGLGTYSMRLLGEKYLNGKVWLESTQEKGTTFFIEV
jgi:hypothetical protein